MTAFLLSVFVASLVGSLHCAGMCGGIVALCVGLGDDAPRRTWPLHVGYHGGRLVAYTALGAISGTLGAALDIGGDALGWQRSSAWFAGGAMIAIGVIALVRAAGVPMGCGRLPAPLQKLFQRGLGRVAGAPPALRSVSIGLLTGLLPCGWLYAFVVAAAATGSAATGGLTMAVFWAGTVPILLGVGLGVQAIAAPLRRHVPVATAVLLVLIGAATVWGRIQLPSYSEHVTTPAVTPVGESTPAVPTTPPCCHERPAREV